MTATPPRMQPPCPCSPPFLAEELRRERSGELIRRPVEPLGRQGEDFDARIDHPDCVLELVLYRAIPRRDVKPLAKSLIAKFGSFGEAVAAPRPRLAEVDGLGDAAITELKVIEAAAHRLARGEVKRRTVLSSWSAVLDYCRAAMAFADKEQFRILFLDKRNQLIADHDDST